MNYFEFRQQLLTNSFTKDEEFHRLRKQDLRCAKAYAEAMEFEKVLKQAIQVKIPANLKDSIILRQSTGRKILQPIMKYAIAASLFLSLLVISTVWYTQQPESVERFITKSMNLESNIQISQQPIAISKVRNIFAKYKTNVGKGIGTVLFIHDCHTPGGTGVHMVVSTDTGLVTVYYMPNTNLDKKQINFDIGDYKAVLVAMQKGSLAIIADTSQQLAFVEPKLQRNLFFL